MIKIYEDNAYVKEFKSKIKFINREKKEIELEKTAFYARGGGQPGDIGTIRKNVLSFFFIFLTVKSPKIEAITISLFLGERLRSTINRSPE